ncbi:MAG: C25 family cysteine peptidase [Candidatus Neomarinimicrobiota bacterium]|nr:C25 family cysteine peptidase [Candidatus Neomarinimicrobiota bacterium]
MLLLAAIGIASAASWTREETADAYRYHWEIADAELQSFIKNGHISDSRISGSFFYEGRYYPLYSIMLSNAPDRLAYRIVNPEESSLPAPALPSDYGEIDPIAIDGLNIRDLQDFVHIREIPGVGSLLEITPLIPQEGGRVRALIRADIQLFSTENRSLQKADLSEVRQISLAKPASRKADLPQEYLALYVREAGMYQISGQDLADQGVDLRLLQPDNIKLFWWGTQIPCRVTSTYERGYETFQYHDVVQFSVPEMKNPYGDYRYNPFSDFDVILMNWGDNSGLRYIQENSEITGNATFLPQENDKFRSTVHIEKNQIYESLARLHEEELSHQYEHRFFSPAISVGRSVSFPFDLWDPVQDSPYNVEFTLRMQGLTYSVDDEMDHQIYVTVNDRYMLEDEWDGQTPNISSNMDMQYSHQYLQHGQNKINISVKGFEDNPYMDDKVLFDWLKISYDRHMTAHDNRLEFSPQYGPGRYLFRVKGLSSASDVLILKNGTNWIRGYYVTPEDTVKGEVFYSIYFEDMCDGDEIYRIAGPGKKDTPGYGIVTVDSLRYVLRSENEHYNTDPQGDYLIVTHKDFYEKARELAEHKQEMGFTPAIYELERIYDEYNYGNESPYAIKNFLTEAYEQWTVRPHYVLFIGDTGTKNSLPVIRYQSSGAIGAIIAENWFVDIDDDFMLEMSLGRLPVSTAEQLDSIIAKIKIFDRMEMPEQAMNRTALLTGPEPEFKRQMKDYINTVSPDYVQSDRLYLYDSHVTGDFDAGVYATDTLVKFINDGVYCINYLGHGGGYTWDNYVLPYSAFEEFNGQTPFIVNSLTCFTNTFSNNNAIGEMFIRHPRAGVSVLSSTGYGWINSNYYIYDKLMRYLYEENMSHGEAVRYALAHYFFSTFGKNANFIDQVEGRIVYKYFRKSLFYQMCILGDPSVRFPQIQKDAQAQVSPLSVSSGQNIEITPAQSGILGGMADLTVMRGEERKYPLQQKIPLRFNAGKAAFVMPPLQEDQHAGILQFSYWDNSGKVYAGKQHMAYDAPHISELAYTPAQPGILDSTGVRIRMQTSSGTTIDQAYLRVYREARIGASFRKLPLAKIADTVFETAQQLYYTAAGNFYTAENDTASPLNYYSGTYFMPVFRMGSDSLSGDFYRLSPIVPDTRDIGILDYSIVNGQSKLVLFNLADSAAHVAIELQVPGNPALTYRDTVLTNYDVQGQYESGREKINTFFLDFLPAYGSGELQVRINPLEIANSDSSNNVKTFSLQNQWLLAQNAHFVNTAADSILLPGTTFLSLRPGTAAERQAIYINSYNRSYMLTDFGASQALQNLLYINTPLESIDFVAVLADSLLSGNKIVAYLNSDLTEFYVLPTEKAGNKVLFPVQRKGYYLLVYSDEQNPPGIEINLNAREILVHGYVSERSDFSVILRDDKGVHPLESFREVLLDDERIPAENINVLSGTNIRELGFNFKLDLEVGEHTLQVIAHDLVGNRAETEAFRITYTGESQLIDYGNFPNPFTVRTTFIYELTEQFDDVRIKIYTVSGQKIYTMSVTENAITDLPLQSIGYHEIPWDGKDEFGNTVANGAYFYVIEGSVDGKIIKSRGKLAKLR